MLLYMRENGELFPEHPLNGDWACVVPFSKFLLSTNEENKAGYIYVGF